MANDPDKVTYKQHQRNDAQGHIFLGHGKQGAVTIGLTGAAAMTQNELNFYGEIFADALNKLTPKQIVQRNALAMLSR